MAAFKIPTVPPSLSEKRPDWFKTTAPLSLPPHLFRRSPRIPLFQRCSKKRIRKKMEAKKTASVRRSTFQNRRCCSSPAMASLPDFSDSYIEEIKVKES
ncbi:hypothetical protein JTE90_020279 [Oedothorax gibbosus]|uniref:Uncharacterized protein n=1 Tax=Oedothorax gibbosus TaxID=931172 RepID=A0AAV6VP67_9ARAC|nr:hypothetical protein JTE90_020279 [Oedothorax gibbosus]